MQRVDNFISYQNTVSQQGQGAAVEHTKATVPELMQMEKGTVFEGVVTEIKEDYVLLKLQQGQTLKARLETGVNVRLGEPLLFQVKSNENNQLLLQQVAVNSAMNPTLQKALQQAGLPFTERNLDMVNIMMQKQMPIDKKNLSTMARLLQNFPEASVQNLVEMKKLGFSITENSIEMFAAYKEGNHSLVNKLEEMAGQVTEFFNASDMDKSAFLQLQRSLLHILDAAPSSKVSETLSKEEMLAFQQQLSENPRLVEDGRIFQDGKWNTDLGTKEFLSVLQEHYKAAGMEEETFFKEVFSGKSYKALLKQAITGQWTLQPQQVENKENIERFYERMNGQMDKIEQLFSQMDKSSLFHKNVHQVQNNLEMMNQINQLYNYVQLPLKFTNQNAHCDLYVYTNKKNLQDRDKELSVLLHLELDNLGTTDIQVKMYKSSVSVNFYMERESSYIQIKNHTDQLQKVLEEKGYHCNMSVENRVQKIDLVEDFLEREAPMGKLQRYSFDVLT